MKSKLQTFAAIAFLAFGSASFAASITTSNFTDFPSTNYITNDAGGVLENTFVAVGYFATLTDSQLQALTPTSFTSILTGGEFVQFASAIGWLGAGVYDGSASSAINAGSSFIGKSAYTIIGNQSTLAGSTELLIAKHSFTFAQDSPLFSASATLDQSSGNGTVLWGSIGKTTSDLSGFGGSATSANYSTLSASAVPEPSRFILMAIGGFCFLARRNKR